MNNSSAKAGLLRTMTDRFQLDTIHQTILEKLSSNPPKQPFILLNEQLLNTSTHNTLLVQMTWKSMSIDEQYSFDIVFQSDSSRHERTHELSGKFFADELIRLQQQFDQRFEQIFQLQSKQHMNISDIRFARSTLSNLIGGISFFTGNTQSSLVRIVLSSVSYTCRIKDKHW
jgi:hypothetical protein